MSGDLTKMELAELRERLELAYQKRRDAVNEIIVLEQRISSIEKPTTYIQMSDAIREAMRLYTEGA